MFRNNNSSSNSLGSRQYNDSSFGYVSENHDYMRTSLNILNTGHQKKKTVNQQKFHEYNEKKQYQHQQEQYQQYQQQQPRKSMTYQHGNASHNSLTSQNQRFYQQQYQEQQQVLHQYQQQQQKLHAQQQLHVQQQQQFSQQQKFLPPDSPQHYNNSRFSLSTTDSLSAVDKDELIERLMTENSGLHKLLEDNELELQKLFVENENLRSMRSPEESLMSDEYIKDSDSAPTELSSSVSLDPKIGDYKFSETSVHDDEFDKTLEFVAEKEEEPELELKDDIEQRQIQNSIPTSPKQQSKLMPEELISDLIQTIKSLRLTNNLLNEENTIITNKLTQNKKILKKLSTYSESVKIKKGFNIRSINIDT
ncbi:hypothetical protein WICMUC_005817 [Wickerhamomyces mucosus]|uniref:Uncharacterized protein n=1 Tax=Wickerhamomyces mucosus TaxID=1378264 RepID=A0A9P8P3A6_9ASCO|nr:hypothetical protein WICMUC_005817 [Wickerhamomyces mucosus]